MTLLMPERSTTLYPVQEVAPRAPLPRRRLRAGLPILLGVAATLLPWTGWLENTALLLLAGFGSVVIWRADAASAVDAWQRAFPGVRLRGVRRLPGHPDGVRPLVRVCEEVRAALVGLDEAPRRGFKAALAARRARRELQSLPAVAAALAVQLERIAAIPDPRVEPRRRRLADQLDAMPALARRIRSAALRQDVAADEAPKTLRALDRGERAWSAELDCADELDELEALFERTSA